MTAARDRLDGWKEISAHVGRGIRTAQRWERDLGMPVHRLSTGAGEAVFAWRAELDAWVVRQSRSTLAPTAADGDTQNGGNEEPMASPAWTSITPVGVDRVLVRVTMLTSDRGIVEAYYTLDRNLRIVDAELGPGADAIHERLEADGVATPATRFSGTANLYPVHRWNGQGWDVIGASNAPARHTDSGGEVVNPLR